MRATIPFLDLTQARRYKARRQRQARPAVVPIGAGPEHDPEKWEPVSRLREALGTFVIRLDASAGEGRSEKIMLHGKRRVALLHPRRRLIP